MKQRIPMQLKYISNDEIITSASSTSLSCSYLSLKKLPVRRSRSDDSVAGLRKYFSKINTDKRSPVRRFGLNAKVIVFSLFGLFVFIYFSNVINAQENVLIDRVAGIVGDKIVLDSDIRLQAEQAKLQGYVAPDVNCQVLDQLLLERLLANQAEIDSVTVSEEEVEIELDNRMRYYLNLVGSEEKFREYYKKSSLQFKEEFRPDIKEIMLAQKMQGQIVGDVKVTPAEVKAFFATIPKDSLPYFNAEVEIMQIVLKPIVTAEADQAAQEKLRKVRERIVSGQNTFEELAPIYSEDPGSGKNGGRLGMQDRGTFVKEFEAVAYKLEKGEVSGLVKTQFGYHILKLNERRGNKVDVQHILIKPEISYEDLDLVVARGDSIKQMVMDSTMSFNDAVEEFSEDEDSKALGGVFVNQQTGSTYFELDQLPPDVFFAVEGLKKGQVSEPTLIKEPDGSKLYKLFYLQSRSEPHQANLTDDYERIKNLAQQTKQNEAVSDWIKDKSTTTYIHLRNEYKECETMVKWVN